MSDEQQNKIYALMAQAEDLQTHAQRLQKHSEETFNALPLAVAQASKEIQRRGLIHALYVLSFGVIVAVLAWSVLYWLTSSTRTEYIQLSKEVAILRANVQDFEKRAGKAKLTTCNDGGTGRLCIEVDKGSGSFGDGDAESYMIIKGY